VQQAISSSSEQAVTASNAPAGANFFMAPTAVAANRYAPFNPSCFLRRATMVSHPQRGWRFTA
jgi:hypothetical protein